MLQYIYNSHSCPYNKGILRRGLLASLVAAEAQEEAKEAANLLLCLRYNIGIRILWFSIYAASQKSR